MTKFNPTVVEGVAVVDDTLTEAKKQAAAENSVFFDANIIPTVQYQVFGLDNAWFWDDEGQNYTFSGTASTINIKVITGTTVNKTYYLVSDNEGTLGIAKIVEPTEEQIAAAQGPITDGTAVPEGAKANDVYYTEETEETYADSPITTPYEFNKYGKEDYCAKVLVTLTPNATLKTSYPGAIITINGEEHDINYNSFRLYMDKDYRISIHWIWGELVETFRIIRNQ